MLAGGRLWLFPVAYTVVFFSFDKDKRGRGEGRNGKGSEGRDFVICDLLRRDRREEDGM